ncbi:hypothetical protein Tco_0058435 [Tanacetum coccineum]
MKKAFQDMLHELVEVNLTHAYHNGSRTSKDNEDPSWMDYKFQDQENSKDIFSFGSALVDFICVVIVLDRNIKNTSIGARDVGFRREKQAKKNLKASYGITTPQELRRNQIKEEISHHHRSIMAEGDIDNLTIEQYLALTRWNQAPGVVKPKNRGNVNFKIKIQFMRELREDTFSGNKNVDAHEHVERVLDIEPSNPGISLKKLLSKGIVYHLRPLSSMKNSVTSSRKEMKHYTKPGKGTVTYFTNAQLTTSIAIRRNIDSSSNTKGIAAIVSELDSLGQDMKKLKENVHAIRVGCQTYRGAHLDKECPLNEEVKSIEEPSSGKRKPSLTKIINKYIKDEAKRHAEQDEWFRKFYQITKTNQENHDKIIQGLEMKVTTLLNKVKGWKNGGKFEECKAIFTKDESPLYTPFYYSPKEIEYFSDNLGFSDDKKEKAKKLGDAENQLPPKEQDQRSFILPYSIRSQKLTGKINKFIFQDDFVILDMLEDFRMPIILGRPLLATAHAKVCIYRKLISLEVGNEKVIFKMRSSFTTTTVESVRAIKSEIHTKEDNLMKIDYDLFLYDFESCEFNHLLGIDQDIFTYDIDVVYKMTCQGKLWEIETKNETNMEPPSIKREKHYWENLNDNERVYLEWDDLSFNDWVRIKFGRVCKMTKDRILKYYWRQKFNDEQDEIEVKDGEDPEECGEDKANIIFLGKGFLR